MLPDCHHLVQDKVELEIDRKGNHMEFVEAFSPSSVRRPATVPMDQAATNGSRMFPMALAGTPAEATG